MSISHIRQQFADSLEHCMKAAGILPEPLLTGADAMVNRLLEGGRIFTCGSGSGAMLSSHLASLLMHDPRHIRPPLPAWHLRGTHCASDTARPEAESLKALAQSHDVLVLLSPDDALAQQMIPAARDRNMTLILIAAEDSVTTLSLAADAGFVMALPAGSSARITETQLLVVHALCDHIEQQLFGDLA
jgi:D-sedoheptulose 7-phosphate isomerase